MGLQEEFENEGNWLFRWRSYLPLVLVIPMTLALGQFASVPHDYWRREAWEGVCMLISIAGAGLRIATVGFVPARTSGRNTQLQLAESLNTTGLYSIVRHPLYLANFLIWLGVVMFLGVWWFAVLFVALFWLYYERIMYAEEQFLRRRFGEQFVEWSVRVPPFIPNLRKWQKPSLPFSLRTVLKREYTTWFALGVGFPVLDVVEDTAILGHLYVENVCIVLACIGTVTYLTLRTLKKKTAILHVEGR